MYHLTLLKVKVKSLSPVRLCATPWTVAYQAPLSMGFSRQECWSGLPFPSPGDLPDPGMEGMEPGPPALQADSLPTELRGKPPYNLKAPISALLTMPQLLTVWITTNCGKFFKRWEYQTTWPAFWEICMQVKKQQLELDMEQQTGSK